MATKVYVVLDDQGKRLQGFPNDNMVRLEHLHAVENIENRLYEIQVDPDAELSGMLIDFHLLGDRPADWDVPSALDDAVMVPVDTGLGVMSYMRQFATLPSQIEVPNDQGALETVKLEAVPIDLPLFALTSFSHPHHAFFWSAAHLWFGARPIDALMDMQKLRRILAGDDPANLGNQPEAVDGKVRASVGAFEELLNSCLEWRNCREAYYWFKQLRQGIALNSFRGLKIGLDSRYGKLQRVRHNGAAQEFNEFAYNRLLCQWQELAAEYVTTWGGSTDGWPDIGLARAENGPAPWNERNPVLDLVKDGIGVGGAQGSGAYSIFFSQPDVLEALLYWRMVKSGHADWKGGCIVYREIGA